MRGLSPGSRLGAFEIVAAIGSGGMGEVYKARDSRLGRDVALKILPEGFARDADRLARFRREAQVLASLNHPHIAAIYGVDEADGVQFLVLELVDGETLADRLTRGRVAVDEALAIARQLAEALEAAHDKGIVHRDLKPANIALTSNGDVKVLDFGLAKPAEAVVSGDLANSPTLTSPTLLTGAGTILGTAAYMSPEQAKGRPADKRSDVWGFGCVLFELLSGQRAFAGEDVSETLASVLKGEPDWKLLPSDVPSPVRSLIEGCLHKDRKQRIGDLSTARFLLNQPTPSAATPAVRRRGLQPLLWLAGGLLIGAAAMSLFLTRPHVSPPAPLARFTITLPAGQQLALPRASLALSPDGTQLVYVADGKLYVRALAGFDSRPLAGADPGMHPAFSPDGRSVVFWAGGLIKHLPLDGGAPTMTVGATPSTPSGITWSEHGIVFAEPDRGIIRFPPGGGTRQVLMTVAGPDVLLHGPQLLPGGRVVLYTSVRRADAAVDAWEKASVIVRSLESGEEKTLIPGATDGRYIPTGHILYGQNGSLYAVPFDAGRLALTGDATAMVEGIRRASAAMAGSYQYAVSDTGVLAYVPGPASSLQQSLFLYDRKGVGQPLQVPVATYGFPRVSPDGARLAVEVREGSQAYVAIYDLSGATAIRRLTFGGNNRNPIWSADGTRVAFASDRDGDGAVFWQPANGGTAERLTKPEAGAFHVPEAWSPSGDTLLFSESKGTQTSLWAFNPARRTMTPVNDTTSVGLPTDAVFSPDGRWIAYQIGDANVGEATTFVQPFPPTGEKYQIARGGRPAWSRDGTELFVVPAPGRLLAFTVHTRPSFSFSNPVDIPRAFGVAEPGSQRTYDPMPDGRFVGINYRAGTPGGAPLTPEIRIVLNWFEELKARVRPSKR